MNTICSLTPPRASYITPGMHVNQQFYTVNAPKQGQPTGEDWNVSWVNTIQVLIKDRIGMCLVGYAYRYTCTIFDSYVFFT